jgi:hypothetical protein
MDLGNISALEHVNVRIPDQRLATIFYVMGLGLTRDPYLMTGIGNMWINIGRSQFHMPTGQPQVVRGHVGLVIPDRAQLLRRLADVREHLAGTKFDFKEHNAYVEAISPWGNVLRIYEPAPEFGPNLLAMPYVEFDVAEGTTDGIVRFYREILETPAEVIDDKGPVAKVTVGIDQYLRFRETAKELPAYDGHHLQIYINSFAGTQKRLEKLKLIFEYSDKYQYRFLDIVDPDTGRKLFSVEHEVRAYDHPLRARPLVNRNPSQTNTQYVPGADAMAWQAAE